VDVDQGKQSWVVLADPEGNEFCVLSSRRSRLESTVSYDDPSVSPEPDRPSQLLS
jgi:hypothetical protein